MEAGHPPPLDGHSNADPVALLIPRSLEEPLIPQARPQGLGGDLERLSLVASELLRDGEARVGLEVKVLKIDPANALALRPEFILSEGTPLHPPPAPGLRGVRALERRLAPFGGGHVRPAA